jgi:iron(III) transport system permease protein
MRQRPDRGRRGAGLGPFVAAAGVGAALVGVPLLALGVIAFGGEPAVLRHVWHYVLPQALRDTLLLLLGVALVTSVLGVGTAWIVTAYRFRGRGLVAPALMLPLAIPTYIVAYIYVEILDPLGPVQTLWRALWGFRSRADYSFIDIRSLPGAIVIMGLVLYPYLYLSARALFAVQSASLLEVGRTLGAGPLTLFRHVALPLARPAVALGLTLVLLETLNDIGASEYLGVRTLSVSIYTTWLNRGSLAGAAQIACAMLLVVLVILLIERRARGQRRFAASPKHPRPIAPLALEGWRGALALGLCLIPVFFGFVLPAGFLAQQAMTRLLAGRADLEMVGQLATTIALAGTATGLIIGLGVMIAAGARLLRGKAMAALARLAGLGYAIPGTVLAIGLLWPMAGLDNIIADLVRQIAGVSPGLLLTGSGFAIVLAYLARFLGIAIGGIESGFARISPRMDDAARALGRRPREVLSRIHLPLLRPSIVSAALLVFVDCCKELPATLLLRPLNLETLATRVYADASRGLFEEGALAALLIVLVGLVPVVIAARPQARDHVPPIDQDRALGPALPLAS